MPSDSSRPLPQVPYSRTPADTSLLLPTQSCHLLVSLPSLLPLSVILRFTTLLHSSPHQSPPSLFKATPFSSMTIDIWYDRQSTRGNVVRALNTYGEICGASLAPRLTCTERIGTCSLGTKPKWGRSNCIPEALQRYIR